MQNRFLVGELKSSIDGDQLPSNGQVLRVLFYNMLFTNPREKIRVSAKSVIEQVKVFWERVRLPVKKKEQKFSADLENLFDIADVNVMESKKIDQKSKDFLRNQHRDGRMGSIFQIEKYYEQIDHEKKKKKSLWIRSLNDLLTRNEDQKMFMLQIVSEYRKMFPDAKKETIMQKF
ncbi:hypothetical protein ALC62_13797 [Cyphomyrmex costatus]|uniref:Uncharacterized protein n=1 Tax=Cyphomyrmex costatus TaxID=456900 RepID=A0A151I9A5_9HYME|nr:hypothetical protein ALC62_13797 [Cyphomyrmex costatus]